MQEKIETESSRTVEWNWKRNKLSEEASLCHCMTVSELMTLIALRGPGILLIRGVHVIVRYIARLWLYQFAMSRGIYTPGAMHKVTVFTCSDWYHYHNCVYSISTKKQKSKKTRLTLLHDKYTRLHINARYDNIECDSQ